MDPAPFPAEPSPPRRRLLLVVAGVLLLLAPFLYVNPLRYDGTSLAATGESMWPWERFPTTPVAAVVEVCLLTLLGALAVAAGARRTGSRLPTWLLALGGYLALRHHGFGAAYRYVSPESFGFAGFVTTVVLASGALRLRDTGEDARRTGRGLVAAGVLFAVALAGGVYPKSPPIPDVNLVQEFVQQTPARLDALAGRGPLDADGRRAMVTREVAGKAVPELAYGLAVLLAALAALRSRRARLLAGAALASLLLAWAVPLGYAIALGVDDVRRSGSGTILQVVTTFVSAGIVETGFVLALLATGALAALLRTHPAAPPGRAGPAVPATGGEGRAARLAFVAAGLCALAALWVGFRPETGLLGRSRVTDVLASGFGWNREVATALAVGTVLFAAVAGAVRGGGGSVVVAATLTATFVLEHAMRTLAASPDSTWLGVAPYAPLGLAAVALGGAGSSRPLARRAAGVAAFVLAAILWAPTTPSDPDLTAAPPPSEFGVWALHGARETRSLGEFLGGFVAGYGCPAVIALLSLVPLFVAWELRRTRPGAARSAGNLGMFVGAVLVAWALVQMATAEPVRGRFDPIPASKPSAVERVAAFTVFAFLAPAFCLVGAAAARRSG